MQNNSTFLNYKKTKRALLVFLCLVTFYQCKTEKEEVRIIYKDKKAVSVQFYIDNAHKDDISFFILDNYRNAIVGNLTQENNTYIFTPIIPFSSGQHYQLHYKGQSYNEFVIKDFYNTKKPKVLAIYPSKDTVPENLLKMYFVFSEPMAEVGKAIDYIKVTDTESGLEKDVFLELQPELWNKEHTILTLWLDPGRIKKGLIPNLEKGPPLLLNNSYVLDIDASWKSAIGNPLDKAYSKTFYTSKADIYMPKVNEWKLVLPQQQTREHLIIHLGETLDAILLQEAIHIIGENNKPVQGKFSPKNAETVLEFYPEKQWNRGEYTLKIETRLEDISGNNLLHLFDTDIINNVSNKVPIQHISFTVK